ncbi:META domain-containing protein [Caballeronia sp. LZ035]|uniref:META domain-containing protein n=1 Tax=Caballeronia sp. LZ035 TaxID=3038568 RepID=UPI002863E246|nr:META domain-containing protein [Caballeronia sp. LZ035]MDR5756564.1 META domain-containing protein [Caballeronia sp. LZ035]
MPTSLFRASALRSSSRFLSRITRTAAGAGAALAVASLVSGCAIPKHTDASAPPTDPYNPAATQLLDDTQWQLARWTDPNGQTRALPGGAQGGAQGTAQADAASAGQPLTLDFSTASGRRRASGFAGCNRFAGTYDLKDGKLSFGPLAGTRMACAGGTGAALEQPYLDGLAHVARSGVQMNPPQSLQLTLEDGQVLVFAPRAK